jgi:hypothetical protein
MNLKHMILSLACLVGGCNGNIDASATAAQDSQLVERTIVKLLPDGNEEVKTEQVTVGQQRQEWAARQQRLHPGTPGAGGNIGVAEEELVSVDSGCAASSMWIFDSNNSQIGAPPFNHEICFYKSSSAPPVCTDLRQYVRQCFVFRGHVSCQDWANSNGTGNWIGSFWSGHDTGMFLDLNGADDEGFGTDFQQNNAQQTIATAVYLCFN